MKKIFIGFITASLLTLGACNNDFENNVKETTAVAGSADFSKYIALGNSLTSGYADGALYRSAQEHSFPAIIAQQMRYAGGGEFTQPLMPDDVGGFSELYLLTNGESFYGKLELQMLEGKPIPVPSKPKHTLIESIKRGSFNNLGVPGAKSFHLLAEGYGNILNLPSLKANPYFVRFASEANSSILQDALKQSPTFFSLWIGNNDVLGYAMGGASAADQQGNTHPATYGLDDLSDANVVAGSIQKILEKLVKEGGAKGVIANIPNVQDIPFFTTITSTPLNAQENKEYAAQIPSLNAFFSPLNKIYEALGAPERKITFSAEKNNGVIIKDESLANLSAPMEQALRAAGLSLPEARFLARTFGQTRLSKEGDLFPLPMAKKIGKLDESVKSYLVSSGFPMDKASKASITGLTYPIGDAGVLTIKEVDLIKQRIAEINQKIAFLAKNYGLAHVDVNGKMAALKSGMVFNGNTFDASFIKGGAFSLDGVHLNGKGYALVANFFIEAINATYGSTLPMVDINKYAGTTLP